MVCLNIQTIQAVPKIKPGGSPKIERLWGTRITSMYDLSEFKRIFDLCLGTRPFNYLKKKRGTYMKVTYLGTERSVLSLDFPLTLLFSTPCLNI